VRHQTIGIDPDVWAAVRRAAHDRETTASAIMEIAAREWLARTPSRTVQAGLIEVQAGLIEVHHE